MNETTPRMSEEMSAPRAARAAGAPDGSGPGEPPDRPSFPGERGGFPLERTGIPRTRGGEQPAERGGPPTAATAAVEAAKAAAARRAALQEQLAKSLGASRITVEDIRQEIFDRLPDFPVADNDPLYIQVILSDIVLHHHLRLVTQMLEEARRILALELAESLRETKDTASAVITKSAQYQVDCVQKRWQELMAEGEDKSHEMKWKTVIGFRTTLAAFGVGGMFGMFVTVLMWVFHGR